jgi:hypothetical protein
MADSSGPVATSSAERLTSSDSAFARLSRAALPTIALGLGNKLLLQVVAVLAPAGGNAPFITDLGSRLTWSVVVCGGLAAGIVLGRRRAAIAGIAGFVAAPIAFDLARAVRRGVVGYLQLLETIGAPSPIAVGAIKGVEYACLGVFLSWLVRHGYAGPVGYACAGLIVGVLFGGAILGLNLQAGIADTASVLQWLVNELLFPVGCALVVYQTRGPKRLGIAAS